MEETASEELGTDAGEEQLQFGRLAFDYIKSTAFRVVHVDGVVGGLTPRGDFSMSLWSERLPIPKSMIFQLSDDGELGKEIQSERVGRRGLIREVDCCAVFDLNTARLIRDWLSNRIQQVEDAIEMQVAEKTPKQEKDTR